MKYLPILHVLLDMSEYSLIEHNGWIYAKNYEYSLDSGWKLHISATAETAPVVLAVAVPILRRYKCSFKICSTSGMLNSLNGRKGNQSQTGKFMTIYPQQDIIISLAQELVSSLNGMVGPSIPTDKPFKQNSIVSYRYGAFKDRKRINEDGEIEYLYNIDGEDVVDQRNVYYTPPSKIDDPFQNVPFDDTVQLIGTEYEVYSALLQSPKGGVYLAKDRNQRTVIIKEARKWTGGDDRGFEGRTRLALEYITLLRAENIPGVPKAYNYFLQDGNAYLVQEYIPGEPLLIWIQNKLKTGRTPDIKILSRSIRRLIHMLHKKQIIHRDISPNNILVMDESNVALIDFEFSIYEPLEIKPVYSGTPGYIAPWVSDISPATKKDDWFAVTQIIFAINALTSPVKGMSNSSKIKLLRLVNSTTPSSYLYQDEKSVELARSFIRDILMKDPQEDWSGPGAAWCLHHGMAGIVHVAALLQIHSHQHKIEESVISKHIIALRKSVNSVVSQANGLHFGLGGYGLSLFLAGVAWKRGEWLREGADVVLKSCESQLRSPKHFDWTHGSAGLLHAALIIYKHTGDTRFLNVIRRLEAQLLNNSTYIGRSLYWKSEIGKRPQHYLGFAHGIAGIGYALASSYRITKNLDAYNAVLNIFNTLSVTNVNSNWRNSVEDDKQQYYWCHGAPGIIHFLVSILEWESDALSLANQAATKMKFMNGMPPLSRCHGITSLTSAYHDLYRATNNKIYHENVCNTLIYINELREPSKFGPGWMGDNFKVDRPSLMTGSLGIAYSILQEAYNLPDPILLREHLPKNVHDISGPFSELDSAISQT